MKPLDDALLSCSGLAVGYNSTSVLNGIDLELKAGSSTVLLGPNGSGKSTLMKTFCRNLDPLEGTVVIEGQDAMALSFGELAQKVAFVPQEEIPPFRFSVRQIVLMGRMPLSTSFFDSQDDLAAAEEAMIAADCASLADRSATEISGGERQRA